MPRPLILALILAACELKIANETDDASTTGDSASTTGDSVSTTPTTGEPWTLDGCMTRFHWSCAPPMSLGCAPPAPLPLPNCGGRALCDPLPIGVSAGKSS